MAPPVAILAVAVGMGSVGALLALAFMEVLA